MAMTFILLILNALYIITLFNEAAGLAYQITHCTSHPEVPGLILNRDVFRHDIIYVAHTLSIIMYTRHCVSLTLVSHHRFMWEDYQLPVKMVCEILYQVQSRKVVRLKLIPVSYRGLNTDIKKIQSINLSINQSIFTHHIILFNTY